MKSNDCDESLETNNKITIQRNFMIEIVKLICRMNAKLSNAIVKLKFIIQEIHRRRNFEIE